MDAWQRTHHWGGLTRDEIRRARDAGALPVLPVGSCEQHGDYLPVDTDAVGAHRVALLAAERCEAVHVLVLPPANFGFAPEHAEWPGTVTLSLATFLGVVTEIAESLHRTGFGRLLIVNGHGGNQGALTAACAGLASRGLRVGAVPYWGPGEAQWAEAVPGRRKTVGHACAYETALQMALRPEEQGRIAAAATGLPARLVPPYLDAGSNPFAGTGFTYPPLFTAGDPGYYGDPAAATPEAGALLLEHTVAGLAAFYATFASAPLKAGSV